MQNYPGQGFLKVAAELPVSAATPAYRNCLALEHLSYTVTHI